MILKAPPPRFRELSAFLLDERKVESCAIAFTRPAAANLVIERVEAAPLDAYAARSTVEAVLRPEFVLDVVNRARLQGLGCVFAHSHPHEIGRPRFSAHDDAGERRLDPFLRGRAAAVPHVALVAGPKGLSARRLGSVDPVIVREVGSKLMTLFDPSVAEDAQTRHDRQIRAFGLDGQARIAGLHVGVVGAGGTGSVTIQQLAHIGVKAFTIVDFDSIDETSLNRLVGAGGADVDAPKVEIARRSIARINPDAAVVVVRGDVTEAAVAAALLDCDIIFLCTDSHASRAIVSQIAYQYLIPTIDMGVSLSVRDGRLAYITGRVQLLAPGQPCLHCMGWLDTEQIRREMLTPEARAADPYIPGVHEPQPSVISLNSTMASLAVTMFIGVVTDAPVEARCQIYDGVRGTVRVASATADERCLICSETGGLARGDSWPLPTRT